jgi:hypothetical protein
MSLMLAVFIIPVILVGLIDLIPVIKSGNKRIAIAYLAVTTCALVLWTLQARSVHLKSPNEYIQKIVESIVTPMD